MKHDPLRALAVGAAVATVALTAAAFWLSYEHLHDIASANGLDGARAWAWPGTVDLFIIVGELLYLRASLAGRQDRLAVGLTAVGSLGSIALNVAGVGTEAKPLEYVVAAVPPLAALIAFGALMRQVHERLAASATPTATVVGVGVTPPPPAAEGRFPEQSASGSGTGVSAAPGRDRPAELAAVRGVRRYGVGPQSGGEPEVPGGSIAAPEPTPVLPVPVEREEVPAPAEAVPVKLDVMQLEPPTLPLLGPFRPLPSPSGTGGGTDLDQELSALLGAPEPEVGTAGTGPVPDGGTGGTDEGDSGTGDSPQTRFERHVTTARQWLAEDPGLSGTAIGQRLGTGDSYGRRVRRAALSAEKSAVG